MILVVIFILVTFPLLFTFIHSHSPSFTFIHFQFSSFHESIHQKRSFIKNVHAYILGQPSTHIGLFSPLKRVTLTQQMRLKYQCHNFKQKGDEKGRVYANTCASRSKKEWMNEWINERMNEWMNEWMNGWMDEWKKTSDWLKDWKRGGEKKAESAHFVHFFPLFLKAWEITKRETQRAWTPGTQLAKAACPTAKLRAPGTRARTIFRPAYKPARPKSSAWLR